ncbi:DUF397 domain-containing protein [Streptomyces misionensis]|uniref:DUF397 domain-containing protein n=1 Tax=Streptomyces misionensis TaxID=67331 RepID=A0A5C6J4I6_9ACTN|nr:DUF397 domain-containing protein [Streptomyces misionensis]TWV35603.1 DUF397 domain-containing protein [Streptomyces misionensis]
MREYELTKAHWRKSTYSTGDASEDCVEVADGVPGVIPVRDSKLAAGPVLLIGPDAWTHFIDTIGAMNSQS